MEEITKIIHLRKIKSRMNSRKELMKNNPEMKGVGGENWTIDSERDLYEYDLRTYNKMENISDEEYLKIHNSVLEYGKEFRGRIRGEQEFLSRIESELYI